MSFDLTRIIAIFYNNTRLQFEIGFFFVQFICIFCTCLHGIKYPNINCLPLHESEQYLAKNVKLSPSIWQAADESCELEAYVFFFIRKNLRQL